MNNQTGPDREPSARAVVVSPEGQRTLVQTQIDGSESPRSPRRLECCGTTDENAAASMLTVRSWREESFQSTFRERSRRRALEAATDHIIPLDFYYRFVVSGTKNDVRSPRDKRPQPYSFFEPEISVLKLSPKERAKNIRARKDTEKRKAREEAERKAKALLQKTNHLRPYPTRMTFPDLISLRKDQPNSTNQQQIESQSQTQNQKVETSNEGKQSPPNSAETPQNPSEQLSPRGAGGGFTHLPEVPAAAGGASSSAGERPGALHRLDTNKINIAAQVAGPLSRCYRRSIDRGPPPGMGF
uniref:Uncharacterized protein n=1 Tax=Chromera velia CCMP2878 TaxID=1169474 RepID=A0A0G4HK12_9ALVE|eukprot:Cvel_7158.t1-p1 / transcript=Cvel_7158.t1 / gene=Cvel_7158 / organism=Chromera_velia_CCMP2878 / gene_product=hypothetical protein / transcript_product=hypothetical protein / location=Cvel_scaffold368:59330-60226(+) / protein_length=299 / sequence_SO=supercontig / SO=protein_coding / is_pseudo=false